MNNNKPMAINAMRPHRIATTFTLLLTLGLGGVAQADQTTRYSYNALGLVETIDGPRTDVNDITTFDYNAQGYRIRIANALGHTIQITQHDGAGRPLTLIDPNGLITELGYDARGRLTSKITGGLATTYAYDPVGNLIQVTQPDGSYIRNTYDAAHRLIAIEDNQGNRIDYTLDAMGNRLSEAVKDDSGVLKRTHSNV
jgi:YD repeat-containing protein